MPDLSLFDLSGKKALVTGGAMGIGRGCAFALARAGAAVAVVDRNEEIGNKTAENLKEIGDAIFVSCDVSDAVSVQNMVEKVAQRFGRST